MDTHTRTRPALATTPASRGRAVGVALMLSSSVGSQSGAALGALAFPVIGPVGVVAVRQWVAGLIMLAVGRPRLRAFTWWQWRPIMALAAVFATMNLSLYTAIDRIGLGLAVTLEFLGPLTVALVGAFTGVSTPARRRVTVICALLAGAGVVVLTRPRGATDFLGIGLGLLAALCWAGYILLNRTVGRRAPGVEGSAAAGTLSALAYVPVGIAALLAHPPTPAALACAAAAGLLSSAVPFLADLLALRRVPAHSFGIFMSVSPVVAAGIGTVVLGEALAPIDWLAIGLIVTANAASIVVTPATAPRPGPATVPRGWPSPPRVRRARAGTTRRAS